MASVPREERWAGRRKMVPGGGTRSTTAVTQRILTATFTGRLCLQPRVADQEMEAGVDAVATPKARLNLERTQALQRRSPRFELPSHTALPPRGAPRYYSAGARTGISPSQTTQQREIVEPILQSGRLKHSEVTLPFLLKKVSPGHRRSGGDRHPPPCNPTGVVAALRSR